VSVFLICEIGIQAQCFLHVSARIIWGKKVSISFCLRQTKQANYGKNTAI